MTNANNPSHCLKWLIKKKINTKVVILNFTEKLPGTTHSHYKMCREERFGVAFASMSLGTRTM